METNRGYIVVIAEWFNRMGNENENKKYWIFISVLLFLSLYNSFKIT
jgi:hypothetical protein